MSDIEVLFRPGKIGTVEIRNRVLMAPMTRQSSPGGTPTQAVADYYRRRAAGGVGLIIGEAAAIPHIAAAPYPNVPHLFGEAMDGWRLVLDAVHAAGAKMFAQPWHAGSTRELGLEPHPEVAGYSPSGLKAPDTPHGTAMTAEDIQAVIEAYGAAARNCREAGFDGIELHGAHGYLIDQFLWDGVNRRDDAFGGSPANRLRFGQEVIKACRAAAGPDFPVIIRLSQWKQQDYSVRIWPRPADLETTMRGLVDAGADGFHCSTRRFWEPGYDGDPLTLAGWMRKLSGKPVIAVGSVGLTNDFLDPDPAKLGQFRSAMPSRLDEVLNRIASGEIDFVALGRALIPNPAWANLVREGRFEELKGFEQAQLGELR